MASSHEWSPQPRTRLKVAIRRSGRTQERLAEELNVDPGTISRWVRGIQDPDPARLEALAQALGISRAQLGDLLAESGGLTAEAREWLSTSDPVLPSAPDRVTRTGRGTRPAAGYSLAGVGAPRGIGWGDVSRMREVTRKLASAENSFGGAFARDDAQTKLRWALQFTEFSASNDVARAMTEAVGNLASVAAFCAFDAGDHEAADDCFAQAIECAVKSGSWALRANTYAEMSRKAAWLGELDDALTLIELALVRADRLTATARAMLCTIHARLLAQTGRHAEALDEIERADAHFAERIPAADPPWLCYYDDAEHSGSTGKALIPIARATSRPELAVGRLTTAVSLQGDEYPRSRTFSRIRLASLLMTTGHPDNALGHGVQALNDVATLQSARLRDELAGLARASIPYTGHDDIAQLHHGIRQLATSDATPRGTS
ncbi:helix-turn-helix domain-containing protein [Amycolatopsis jiangsuensis]|uniref:Transcriptional regulator with XRE-family HTH domain n=1 Tax=Amycolatopsis jiangsuensis TaxID=1181879 RepID=A0A840INH3_9PSEU|nr:helix-turn-helix domain-containing protein [Amycolatopsis jiangsuensis]MBB4682624.1 transcriptional regulator with XRE-family HTH domain [Amycolatopsis jiangsuensis]